tara:strand:+ start:7362 stop:7616 length:255 start_codon:yes stop_codon:yes gene_type:complete
MPINNKLDAFKYSEKLDDMETKVKKIQNIIDKTKDKLKETQENYQLIANAVIPLLAEIEYASTTSTEHKHKIKKLMEILNKTLD